MTDETSEYYDEPVDVKGAQEVFKRNQPPRGNYTSIVEEYEPTITPTKYDGDDRQFYTVFLRGVLRTKDGEHVEQGLRFKLSAETRAKRDRDGNEIPGKDDIASRLWAEAVAAYVAVQGDEGEPLKTKGQLFEFIKTTPLVYNTMNGDGGNLIVLNISAPRKQRR